MDIDLKCAKLSFCTFIKVSVFMLIVFNLLALGMCISPRFTYLGLINNSWIIIWGLPIIYGLINAASLRLGTITVSNPNCTDEVLGKIDHFMEQRGEVCTRDGNKIEYHAKTRFGRFMNRISDVYLTVEITTDNAIIIKGNKNLLSYMMYELKKI